MRADKNVPLTLLYIRRKSDGCLSTGVRFKGHRPGFTLYQKNAKMWNHPTRVRQHLSNRIIKYYRDCEILTITIDLNSGTSSMDRRDIMNFLALVSL